MGDMFDELNMTPSTIDFNNISKTALGKVSGAVIDEVENGNENALEVFIKAKAIIEFGNSIIKGVKENATVEAEKYGKDDSKLLGCGFVVKNGATRYSFDHDETWAKMAEEMKELKDRMSAREKDMIEATKYAELTDNNGEVIPPAEIKSHGGQILTLTIPK